MKREKACDSMTRVEYMNPIVNETWIIRVWMDEYTDEDHDYDHRGAVERVVYNITNRYTTKRELARELMNEFVHLNAVEVIEKETGLGVVLYPEWP